MASVGRLIVDTLVRNGIDRVFCVPGESYLGLLDALYGRDDIDTVVCRHEAGAGFMALADARLSGVPGIACVSRGPGASNAAIAVHTAQQDAVPFILIVGQVAAQDVRRDSFQEIDYGHMFGRMAKWTAEITDPARAPEVMLRALVTATSGTPGPVVIAVPEDVLTAPLDAEPVAVPALPATAPDPARLSELRDTLSTAERPVVLVGSAFDRPGGREAVNAFLADWQLPAVVSFRRQDLLDNTERHYAGDMGLANPADQMTALREADLLLVLGARLSDITTQGYSYPRMVRPEMQLVHVHADPAQIGTHFAPDLSFACDPVRFVREMGALGAPPPNGRADWIDRLRTIRNGIAALRGFSADDGIPFEKVVHLMGEHLPEEAIVTVDAGTFGAPVYRVVPFRQAQRLLAPISGAMGFGVPAAVAAGLRRPGVPVICLVGDGGFMMTGSELSVAMERGLPLKVILSENGVYASIRINQERAFPGRPVGTGFTNPDFELFGKAYGFEVTRMRTEADLDKLPALLAAPGPQFIIVDTSLDAVLPKKD
ncbi:MAG: pyruvate decarboxylase [Nisaea sp.]|uniref:thiamine pyrophosphate-binding protein n=1 Tax=Nisaea sp. TaxID=2024842 RepID=UPI001AFD289E|nr:thiamine pyrophosphate-binding protein [Nisaea sp.]MBO6561057.1 pyruvate decarboxylase [Nisaea sp.]